MLSREQLVSLLRQALSGLTPRDMEEIVEKIPPQRYVLALLAEVPKRLGPLYSERLVARILRREWRSIEPYLTSAPRALALIREARPDIAEVLARHPAWFNEFVKALYTSLYKWAWGG